MQDADERNTGSPVFFVSYARPKPGKRSDGAPAGMNDRLQAFYSDLTANMVQLVASTAGEDPGFIDTELESGTRWRAELLNKLGGCQVFVALLSAAYVQTSAWCAMEWDLFSRRRTLRNGKPHDARSIIPVIWAPIAERLPPAVADVQRFVPALPTAIKDAYRKHGIFGLRKTDPHAYDAVVWSLSLEIQRLFHDHRVEPLFLRDTRGLRRTFGTDETS